MTTRNYRKKIPDQQVHELRARRSEMKWGDVKALAYQFGVSQSWMCKLITGRVRPFLSATDNKQQPSYQHG